MIRLRHLLSPLLSFSLLSCLSLFSEEQAPEKPTKKPINSKNLGGTLTLGGEIKAKCQAPHESKNGNRQRGKGTDFPSPNFGIECSLGLDYRADQNWAIAKIKFDNDAGMVNGTHNKVKLDRAFFGVRFLDQEEYTTDVEIGRRKLGHVFDSHVQFDSLFDGILLKYDRAAGAWGDFYARLGGFLVDRKESHYGYVGELGLLGIQNTGLFSKYSLIDWDAHNYKSNTQKSRYEFLVSQLTLGYRFTPCFNSCWAKGLSNKAVTLYLAGLQNHAAKRRDITNGKKAHNGGYIGVSLGELKKKGDWAFDMNYQYLPAQTVPDFDVAGIGMGNASRSGLYTQGVDGSKGPTTRESAQGNGNYKGYSLTLDYLAAPNLNIQQEWQESHTLDKDIGPSRKYNQYRIELIYVF